MNNIMIRLCTVIMLMMFSMAAGAIDVQIVNDGKFEGGEIAFTQDTPKDGQVTVTFYVTPYSGYTISKKDITVVSTIPTGTAETRAEGPTISKVLELDGDDPEDLSEKRTYTVTVDEGLGVWVQKAEFSNSEGTKGNRDDYSGTYFIANGNGYSSSNVASNFYLVPATNSNYATDQPHLTTTKSGQVLNCCWQIVKSGDYYRIIHVADGKYLTANPAYSGTSGNDVGRLRVHLEEMVTPDDNTLFEIKVNSNGGYNIRHKDMADKINNSTTTYLDPAGGNVNGTNLTNARTATTSSGKINVGGGIGYWSDEAAARWRFEEVPQNNTYTYNIVDCSGRIAIKYTTGADQPAAKALSSYTDIPEAIRSPYLNGETVKFYSFSGDFSADKLSDENKITATPVTDGANIYVTYTTDLLADRFVKLHGASAFNITVNSKCIYDDSGLTVETTDFSSTTTTKNHLWYFDGDDPYAVEIKNLDTGNLLQFDTTGPTLSVATDPTNKYFIIMDGSTSGAGIANGQMELMAATGDATYYRIANAEALNIDNSTTTGDASLQVRAYPVSVSTRYHLIDKAGKLIEGNIESVSSELGLPDEWKSPLVSEYHYYSTPNQTGDTYAPSGTVTSPFDAPDIYVTYDVGNDIDITGGKNYMLKFLDGDTFNQEDEKDGINDTATPAIYPYNNGEFHLYVYGQKQWDKQLSSGASTRTRWLWHIFSNHDGNNLTGSAIDPYHVIFKSEQNQTVKDKQNGEDYNFPGNTYLRTYKPTGYASVVTDVAYESLDYHTDYPDKMPTQWVNGGATEYMILGTSMLNMKLKTFGEIDGSRQTVTSFEQYWKNNPTANNLLDAGGIAKVTGNEETVSLTTAQRTFLESSNASLYKDVWHSYNLWAYTKPWEMYSNGSTDKALKEGEHWLQTISMGSGEFTLEEISLVPQVILLDQHGWEIVRVPMYSDDACTVINTDALNKYNSPMVKTYHWYPKADKVSGYHKYKIKDSEKPIVIYEKNEKNKWVDSSRRYTHTSTRLSDIPYDHITDPVQDKSVKTDFYVTYTVEDTYARNYQGAATEEAVVPSSYLVKQGGNYATFSGSGTTISTVATKPSRESVTDELLWNLKPNFKIDEEMGFVYGSGDASKSSIESAYYAAGQNGFDPYNVQIQSKAYPLRYFTTNTTGSALNGGTWEGTSSTTVTLQNLGTKYSATGYDQTTLNITNATFMVVSDGSDGNGNMRLMPRFDNSKVMQSFGTLAASTTVGDQGTYLYIELVADAKEIHSSDEITDPNGNYLLASDFVFVNEHLPLGSEVSSFTGNFTGIIDGQLNTISGTLTQPLIANANGATVRNVILENVNISGGTNAGAIAANASGSTRIYNCGVLDGSVSGSGNVGGIVGQLNHVADVKDGARVINCYSYAAITGGTSKGGIVGYNSYASKSTDIRTMVMNCMFYGTGSGIYPIYGGMEIKNEDTEKLNNYNFFCNENLPSSKIVKNNNNPVYNRALAAEERYLVRFEFYRHLLNSTRELAAWYATGSTENAHTKMAKWVLDKSLAPYPILKSQAYYPSVVNYDPEYSNDETGTMVDRNSITERNRGGYIRNEQNVVQELTINISSSKTTGGKDWPSEASITSSSLTRKRIDKDILNYNFNYDKVQLPYFNEVGEGNYTGNKVVTGWKITAMSGTGSQQGTFTANDTWGGYNFADRATYAKDLYAESGRVFSQGAYFDVPKGVTSITIEPFWGKCVYLSDTYYDSFGYNANENTSDKIRGVTDFGQRFTSGNKYLFNNNGQLTETTNDDVNGQIVYTNLATARTALFNGEGTPDEQAVYDYAVVLVGNYHCGTDNAASKDRKPYTIMSADLNGDKEPDYCFIYHSGKQKELSPIRFDFVTVPGTAMAHKKSGTYMGIPGNNRIYGWLEVTNTGLMRFSQLEYDCSDKHNAPLILLGGVVEQIVSTNYGNNTSTSGITSHTPYIHVGSNVWFKLFNNGAHLDKDKVPTPLRPVSVTGGEYEKFYLSGYFQPSCPAYTTSDGGQNAECYISGGSFIEVAGAGQVKIDGDVSWLIDHADITNFYGGGINDQKSITGDITITINNSHVETFCGGPKFGNMSTDKKVKTTATGSSFGTFYGAGYGGTSFYRYLYNPGNGNPHNSFGLVNYEWNGTAWVGSSTNGYTSSTRGKYVSDRGILVEYDYEHFEGSNDKTVARLYMLYASLSLAQTKNVTSNLTGCAITGNFYGGGKFGSVDGSITSTLKNCTISGNVFGAGYSGNPPSLEVFSTEGANAGGFKTIPNYNTNTGVFEKGEYPDAVDYTWSSKGSVTNNSTEGSLVDDEDGHWIHTDQPLNNLGNVNGLVTLTLEGTTNVTGSVYGGGDMSTVSNTTTPANASIIVNLKDETNVNGDVFGGGNQGDVSGTTTVNIMVPEN